MRVSNSRQMGDREPGLREGEPPGQGEGYGTAFGGGFVNLALNLLDWLIVAAYAALVLTIGLYIVKKPKTSEGYFLADRRLKWPFIGASLFASNISAEHFVGLAGGGGCVFRRVRLGQDDRDRGDRDLTAILFPVSTKARSPLPRALRSTTRTGCRPKNRRRLSSLGPGQRRHRPQSQRARIALDKVCQVVANLDLKHVPAGLGERRQLEHKRRP